MTCLVLCVCMCVCVCLNLGAVPRSMLVAQLCPTWSSPGKDKEWIAIPFSRDLPHPGIKPGPFVLQADFLPSELPGKPNQSNLKKTNPGYSLEGLMLKLKLQ